MKFTLPIWPQNTGKTETNNGISRKIALINARVFCAKNHLDFRGALLIEGDKIADFGENLFADGVPETIDKVIDCEGHLLTPGLIDLQVHFREPGFENKETIETGSRSAAKGGITTAVLMPNTNPVIDNAVVVDSINKRASEKSYINIRMYGAITKDLRGELLSEMGLMKEAGNICGFTDDGLPVMGSLMMRNALEYASGLDLLIAQHAEDIILSNKGCINEGEVSERLGVRGIPNVSESVIVARDIELLRLVKNVHYHVLHVSTKEAVELIRNAKKQGLNITAEAAPHHFTLTDEAVLEHNTFAKMNPPLRSKEDRQAVIEALQDGTIDAIATDHAPHDIESKRKPLAEASFGIVGVETLLPLSLELYHKGHLTLSDVIAKLTYRPAEIIKEKDRGNICKNAQADLTLINLEKEWQIKADEFESLSKNTPFNGRNVKGKAIVTIVNGNIVFSEK